jgi:prepilin-type N-terminal cleavage/methylation domain-containing protein
MKRTSAGFSLIEVLVAMAIFAIAASAVTSLMYHSTSYLSGNNYQSQAITCAQASLEHLRMLDYDDVIDDSDECTGDGVSFDVVWEVTEDEPADGAKTIVLTVSWIEKGETKSYELETIYTTVTA